MDLLNIEVNFHLCQSICITQQRSKQYCTLTGNSDSDPEKEWGRPELKCQIGKFLQNPSAWSSRANIDWWPSVIKRLQTWFLSQAHACPTHLTLLDTPGITVVQSPMNDQKRVHLHLEWRTVRETVALWYCSAAMNYFPASQKPFQQDSYCNHGR